MHPTPSAPGLRIDCRETRARYNFGLGALRLDERGAVTTSEHGVRPGALEWDHDIRIIHDRDRPFTPVGELEVGPLSVVKDLNKTRLLAISHRVVEGVAPQPSGRMHAA